MYPRRAKTPTRVKSLFGEVSTTHNSTPMMAASPSRAVTRANVVRPPSPRCWMCERVCNAHGWPTSPAALTDSAYGRCVDFTECLTCSRALSSPPGTSISAITSRCNQTPTTRCRTHSYVSFLREYRMLLEIVSMELGTLDDPAALEQLLMCIDETLSDQLLRPEERRLLLADASSLQQRFEVVSRSQQLEQSRASFQQHEATGSRGPQRSPRSTHYQESNTPMGGVGYVQQTPPPSLVERTSRRTAAASATHINRTPPPASRAHAAPSSSSHVQNSLDYDNGNDYAYDLDEDVVGGGADRSVPLSPSGTPPRDRTPARPEGKGQELVTADSSLTAHLQLIAHEAASKERDWEEERKSLMRRLQHAESENEGLGERLLSLEKECSALHSMNASLTARVGNSDEATILRRQQAMFFRMQSAQQALLLSHCEEKERLLYRTLDVVLDDCTTSARRAKKYEAEIETTKRHLKQQQQTLNSSRAAVMKAWSEAASLSAADDEEPSPRGPAHGVPPAAAAGMDDMLDVRGGVPPSPRFPNPAESSQKVSRVSSRNTTVF